VRDGYHFWAFLLGPLWLLWHRLWLAFVGYAVVIAAIAALLVWLRTGVDTRLVVLVLVAMLMGYEAASLRRWSFSRGRWREIGVVVADDQEAAERRFFDQWTGEATKIKWPRPDQTQPPPQGPGRPGGAHDVIGLFPQPGVPR
jgi:hypothetical protein